MEGLGSNRKLGTIWPFQDYFPSASTSQTENPEPSSVVPEVRSSFPLKEAALVLSVLNPGQRDLDLNPGSTIY